MESMSRNAMEQEILRQIMATSEKRQAGATPEGENRGKKSRTSVGSATGSASRGDDILRHLLSTTSERPQVPVAVAPNTTMELKTETRSRIETPKDFGADRHSVFLAVRFWAINDLSEKKGTVDVVMRVFLFFSECSVMLDTTTTDRISHAGVVSWGGGEGKGEDEKNLEEALPALQIRNGRITNADTVRELKRINDASIDFRSSLFPESGDASVLLYTFMVEASCQVKMDFRQFPFDQHNVDVDLFLPKHKDARFAFVYHPGLRVPSERIFEPLEIRDDIGEKGVMIEWNLLDKGKARETRRCKEGESIELPTEVVNIYHAWYGNIGDGCQQIDITDKVRALYSAEGIVDIRADTAEWGDPCRGKKKFLEIEFSFEASELVGTCWGAETRLELNDRNPARVSGFGKNRFGRFTISGQVVNQVYELSFRTWLGEWPVKLTWDSSEQVLSGKDERWHSETMFQRIPKDAPGDYQIIRPVTVASTQDGAHRNCILPAGRAVRVTKVVTDESSKRIRAEIDEPRGWISLLNKSNGCRWAQKSSGKLLRIDTSAAQKTGRQTSAKLLLTIRRRHQFYVDKYIGVSFIISWLASLSTLVDQKDFAGRSGITLTVLLTLTAINLTAVDALPSVPYATWLDSHHNACMSFVIVVIIQNVIFCVFQDYSNLENLAMGVMIIGWPLLNLLWFYFLPFKPLTKLASVFYWTSKA